MFPFAPARFSTTKGLPNASEKSDASARARKSTDPPGGLVETMRTACAGQDDCAAPATGSHTPKTRQAARASMPRSYRRFDALRRNRLAALDRKPGLGPLLLAARIDGDVLVAHLHEL